MAILIATPVALAAALTWLAPTRGASLLTVDYLPAYRGHIPTAVLGIARQTIPTGAMLGVSTGALAGLLIFLARSRPRLVRWVVLGLLLACIMSFAHIAAFDRVVDFVVKTRLEGVNRLRANGTMRLELASAIGATAGAFVGAVVAYGAVRLSERSRSSLRLRGHGDVQR
jgi:hypothetical protein